MHACMHACSQIRVFNGQTSFQEKLVVRGSLMSHELGQQGFVDLVRTRSSLAAGLQQQRHKLKMIGQYRQFLGIVCKCWVYCARILSLLRAKDTARTGFVKAELIGANMVTLTLGLAKLFVYPLFCKHNQHDLSDHLCGGQKRCTLAIVMRSRHEKLLNSMAQILYYMLSTPCMLTF